MNESKISNKNNDESKRENLLTTNKSSFKSNYINYQKYFEILMVYKTCEESTNNMKKELDELYDDDLYPEKKLVLKLDEKSEKPCLLTQSEKYLVLKNYDGKIIIRNNEKIIEEIDIDEEILNIPQISEDKILIKTKENIYLILLMKSMLKYNSSKFLFILEIYKNEYIISFNENIYYFTKSIYVLNENNLEEKITNVSSIYYFCKILDFNKKKILFIINKDGNENKFGIYKFDKNKEKDKLTIIRAKNIESSDFINENAISIILYNEEINIFICLPNEPKILNINIKESDELITENYFELPKIGNLILNIKKQKEYIFKPEKEKFSNYYMIGFENSFKINYLKNEDKENTKKDLIFLTDIQIEENIKFEKVIQDQFDNYFYIKPIDDIKYKNYYLESK